jgi:hypothetical protein
MASPEAWIKAAIETATGATAWPLVVPESLAPPFVIYQRDSTDRPQQTPGLTGWAEGQFPVEIYADSYSAVKAVADQVRAALHNFGGNANGATIDLAFLTSERDGVPVFFDGRDVPTYLVEQTYFIRWQE